MIPYLILLLTVTLVSYAGRRSGDRVVRSFSHVLVIMLLVCFAGLRDFRIGTDTGNYVHVFNSLDTLQSGLLTDLEVGYIMLNWLISQISESYLGLLLAIAAIVVLLNISVIVRLVKNYEISIYLFIVLGVYAFSFNGARQAIAAAICFYAIRYIIEQRFLLYLLAVLLAMLFHKTALIAIPLYYLASPRLKFARLGGILVAIIFFTSFLNYFVDLAANLLDDRFLNYAEVVESGGTLMGAFLLAQGILLFWFRNFINSHRDVYLKLLNIYLIGLIPVGISILSSVDPSGLLRLQIYFTPVAVLLWPMVFQDIKNSRVRVISGFLFILFSIAFFVLTTMMFSNLVPYRLNTDVFYGL